MILTNDCNDLVVRPKKLDEMEKENKNKKTKQEVDDNLSVCVLNLVLQVSTLPGLLS